jgi:hypothetical protein
MLSKLWVSKRIQIVNQITGSILILILTLGCTRASEDKTKLSFAIPVKQQQLTTSSSGKVTTQSASLEHLVINIAGPGMPAPFIFEWDIESPNPNCTGNICTMELNSGSDRLVQVLGVYKEDSGDYGFYYGDSVKTLQAGTDSVDVNLASVLTTTAIVEAQFNGRYLATANSGPTGKLEVRFKPTNKPSMIIMSTEIYNGWFSVFGLEGVPFDYVVNGVSITDGPIDPATLRTKLGNNLLAAEWPSYYRSNDGGSTVSTRPENARHEFVGFLGPMQSAGVVCYNNTVGQITESYKDTAKTYLDYNTNVTTDASKVFIRGGGIAGVSNCTSAMLAQGTALVYDPVQNKRPFEMSPPFARSTTNGSILDVTAGLATWNYLPDANALIGTVRLFFINSSIADSMRIPMSGDMMRCMDLDRRAAAGDANIRLVGTVPATEKQMTVPAELRDIFKSADGATPATYPVGVLCPILQNGMMMNSVARTWGGGCTTCGGGGPYLRMEIAVGYMSGSNYSLTNNECYQVIPTMYQSGTSYSNSSSTPYVVKGIVALAGTIGHFYTTSACSASLGTDPQIPVGSNQATAIWFKPTVAGSNQQFGSIAAITVTSTSGAATSVTFDASTNKFDVGNNQLILDAPPRMVQNECTVAHVQVSKYGGGFYSAPAGGLNISLAGNANFSIHSSTDTNCSTAGGSINITAGSGGSYVYLKMIATPGSGPHALTGALTAAGFDFAPPSVSVANGGATIDAIKVDFQSSLERGRCMSGVVRLVNFNGGEVVNRSPSSREITLSLPQGSASIFSDGSCSSLATGAILISPNQSSARFSVIFNELAVTTDNYALEASGSGLQILGSAPGTPSKTGNLVITESTEPWYLRIHPPTFNGAEIVGSHEFNAAGVNTYIEIPFNVGTPGSGATVAVQCSSDGSSWSNCSSEIRPNGATAGAYFYKWYAADAISRTAKYLRAYYTSSSGGPGDRMVTISPTALYGTKFTVVGCSAVSGSSTFDTAILNTGVLCLQSGAEVGNAANVTKIITLSGGSALSSIVGHSDKTSVINTSGTSAGFNPILITGDLSNTTVIVANLKVTNFGGVMIGGGGGGGIISIDAPTASAAAYIKLSNIQIGDGVSTFYAGGGLSIVNIYSSSTVPSLHYDLSNLNIKIPGGTNTIVVGIKVKDSSNVTIRNSTIENGSNQSTGIAIISSALSTMNALIVDRTTVRGSGKGIVIDALTTMPISNIEIKNSEFIVKNLTGSLGLAGISGAAFFSGHLTALSIHHNKFITESAVENKAALELASQTDADTPQLSDFSGNILLQGFNGLPAISVNLANTTSAILTVNNFLDNSIAYTGLVANSADAVSISNGSGSLALNINGFSAGSNNGRNRVCSATASNWGGNYTLGRVSGTPPLANVTMHASDFDANSGRCKTP